MAIRNYNQIMKLFSQSEIDKIKKTAQHAAAASAGLSPKQSSSTGLPLFGQADFKKINVSKINTLLNKHIRLDDKGADFGTQLIKEGLSSAYVFFLEDIISSFKDFFYESDLYSQLTEDDRFGFKHLDGDPVIRTFIEVDRHFDGRRLDTRTKIRFVVVDESKTHSHQLYYILDQGVPETPFPKGSIPFPAQNYPTNYERPSTSLSLYRPVSYENKSGGTTTYIDEAKLVRIKPGSTRPEMRGYKFSDVLEAELKSIAKNELADFKSIRKKSVGSSHTYVVEFAQQETF